MKKSVLFSVFALLLMSFATAYAQNVKEPSTGIEFVPQTGYEGKNLSITGVAVRKKFGFKVYAIASYMEAGKMDKSRDPYAQLLTDGPAKLLVLQFVRDVDAGKVKESFGEGLEKNIPNYKSSPAHKDGDAFLNMMEDVKSNDKIELFWTEGGNVSVKIKGQSRGSVKNTTLAQGLWNIWLGNQSILDKKGLVANVK